MNRSIILQPSSVNRWNQSPEIVYNWMTNDLRIPVVPDASYNWGTGHVNIPFGSSKYVVIHEMMHSIQNKENTLLWKVHNEARLWLAIFEKVSFLRNVKWIKQLSSSLDFLIEVDCVKKAKKVMEFVGQWDEPSASEAHYCLWTYTNRIPWRIKMLSKMDWSKSSLWIRANTDIVPKKCNG